MKRATNITELANNLYPGEPISEKNKEFYVEIYKDKIDTLRDEIINGQSEKSVFYVAGQSGTGKTSALNFIAEDIIEKKHEIVHIYFRDLIDLQDIDMIDIVLMFCYKLIEKSDKLQRKFFDQLEKIRKSHGKTLEAFKEAEKIHEFDAGIKAQAGINLDFFRFISAKLNFLAGYRYNKKARDVTREIFKVDDLMVTNLANDIIDYYYAEYGTKKKLLVIFDDLDKIQEPDDIDKLFIKKGYQLKNIACKKIISIPLYLVSIGEFFFENPPLIFYLELDENPFKSGSQTEHKKTIKNNAELLKHVIKKRFTDGLDLISNDAIELAIEKSGGILRQFILLLQLAAKKVRRLKGNKISKADVESAVFELRNLWSMKIVGKQKIELLAEIAKSHKTDELEKEALRKALIANEVLVHSNTDRWYDINPVIKETVRNYSTDRPKLG